MGDKIELIDTTKNKGNDKNCSMFTTATVTSGLELHMRAI